MRRFLNAWTAYRAEREVRGNVPALAWVLRRAYLMSPLRRSMRSIASISCLPVEVVIPCGKRDLETLPLCVESVRRFVLHPIERIAIVTNSVREVAHRLSDVENVDVIDEREWISSEIVVRGLKPGILQQVLKIEGRHNIQTDHYLVVDADTILLRPRAFERNGKYILRYTASYERAYSYLMRQLSPEVRRAPVSFVTHHMLFNKHMLNKYVSKWNENSCGSWIDKAVNSDRVIPCSLSEYEMYANQLVHDVPRDVVLEYWNGINVRGQVVPKTWDQIANEFDAKATASYHWYHRVNQYDQGVQMDHGESPSV